MGVIKLQGWRMPPVPKKFIGSVNRIHPSGLDGVLVVQERLGRKERNDFMFKDAEFHM